MPARAPRRLFGVAGDPVARSLSPRMQMAAIEALGIDAEYLALRTTARAFGALVASVLGEGGGLNVTMPLKAAAAGLASRPSGAVVRTGACNTLWGAAQSPSGDNTDVAAIAEVAGRLAEGLDVARVLLLGTGGAARAAAVAVADTWPAAVVAVGSRDTARRDSFVAWARGAGLTVTSAVPDDVPDLLIAATPADASGGAYPGFPRGLDARAVLDLVYAPGGTALVRAAGTARKEDGRGVLVAQGAAAFRHFFGVEPPVAVMRATVEDALRV